MGEDRIHRRYSDLQNLRKYHQLAKWPKTPDFSSTEPTTQSPRWNVPSFRSKPFNVGEGWTTVGPGQTVTLAKKNLPAGHSGVLISFTQVFEDEASINSITWALRVDGNPVNDFNDFIGQFSLPYTPCLVNLPLIGSDTLGSVSTSPGGTASLIQEVPTVALYATNQSSSISYSLQGRLIGYTFPLSEKADEFLSF